MTELKLNRLEVWIAEHSIRILAVLGVLIVVGGFFVARAVVESGEVSQKVTRIEPQVTRVNKAICDRQSLNHPDRATRCAERIRVGLINCRRSQPCRAALLAAITYPARIAAPSSGGGGALQTGSTGHQPSGPGSPGHTHHHSSTAAPASPPAPSALPAPTDVPAPQTPGNASQTGAEHSQASGTAVEVCVPATTCVKAEVGLGH